MSKGNGKGFWDLLGETHGAKDAIRDARSAIATKTAQRDALDEELAAHQLELAGVVGADKALLEQLEAAE